MALWIGSNPNADVGMHHKRFMMSVDWFAHLSIRAHPAIFLSSFTPTVSTHQLRWRGYSVVSLGGARSAPCCRSPTSASYCGLS